MKQKLHSIFIDFSHECESYVEIFIRVIHSLLTLVGTYLNHAAYSLFSTFHSA